MRTSCFLETVRKTAPLLGGRTAMALPLTLSREAI